MLKEKIMHRSVMCHVTSDIKTVENISSSFCQVPSDDFDLGGFNNLFMASGFMVKERRKSIRPIKFPKHAKVN